MTASRDRSESERAHSNVVRLKVFDHRPHRLSYLDKATILIFPEQSPSARADALDRQADSILARSFDLYVTAYNVGVAWGLFLSGVHAPTMERTPCPIQRGPGTKSLAENGEGT